MLDVIQPRSCGECTACCTAFAIDDPPLVKAVGVKCSHVVDGGGCGVYASRPKTCIDYTCLWLKGLGHAADDRPDRCGFIMHEQRTLDEAGNKLQTVVIFTEIVDDALHEGTPGHEIAEIVAAQAMVIIIRLDGKKLLRAPVTQRMVVTEEEFAEILRRQEAMAAAKATT